MAVSRDSRYRFHCTDGHLVIMDLKGLAIVDRNQVRFHAVEAALYAMERVGAQLDWSDWSIEVHDAQGRPVLVLAFREVMPLSQAA